MPTINSYLNFQGNTEEAFNFYKSVFGGEFATVMRFKDAPGCDEMPEDKRVSEDDKEKIMHIALPIGKGNVLMATDMLDSQGQKLERGNGFSLSLSPESREETDRLFKDLAEDGTVEMPLQDMFWGGYFGVLTDKFGIKWLVNYDTQDIKQ